MSNQKPSFRFEIDNFSKKESAIKSQTFLSGGCEWYLYVHPKGNLFAENHLSLSLYVANIKSLITGWKRNADFYFVVLNQSDKELYRTLVAEAANNLFCAKTPGRVFATLPLSKLQEKGVLVNDKLIIEVYINVVDEEGEEYVSKKKRVVEINGFQVLASQFTSLSKLFDEHPDIAKDFKLKNQVVKTEYMNVLLNLIEAVEKPSKNQSYIELGKARSELSELMEVGFKLDWLKSKLEKGSLESLRSKLEEISLGKKKAEDADRFRVQKLEERLKNLELMGLESLKPKLEDVSLEMKKAYDADRPRVQQLGERFKNIELMESGLKMDSLKSKLKRVSLEMKKAKADGALVQKLEERLKNLEVMELGFKIDCLKSKFEEDSLERNQSYDADGSRVKQLEESVKNLEKIVFELKVELDKKKDKSSADGFLLVDEVA